MKRLKQTISLVCGLLLTLAANAVFAQEKKVEVNKMPFIDFAQMLKEKTDAEAVDLTKSFSVELEGVLTKDGKFDPKQSNFTKESGDAAMVKVGKDSIIAVGDSGFFNYLKDFGVEKFRLMLVQDDKQIYANIVSELETPERTKTLASLLNTLMRMLPMVDKAKTDKGKEGLDDDQKILVGGLNVKSEGKSLTINFAYEKSVIQEMINRRLKAIESKQPASE